MPSLRRSVLASLLNVDLDDYVTPSVIFFLCADAIILAYYAVAALRTKRGPLILLSHILSAQVMVICGALALTVFPQRVEASSPATYTTAPGDVGRILAVVTALASSTMHVPSSVILSLYVPGISTTPGYICVSLLSLHHAARVLRSPRTAAPALFALFCILHIYAFVRAIMLVDHRVARLRVAYAQRYALGVWGASAIVWFVWLDPRVAPPVLIGSVVATALFRPRASALRVPRADAQKDDDERTPLLRESGRRS